MRAERSLLTILATSALILLAVTPAGAGSTGQLSGVVVDDSGAPLPGVAVTTTSPAQIGGEQRAQTDDRGRFLYPRLAPGTYTVRLALEGFLTQDLVEVQVRLDRLTELQVMLPPFAFGDEIEVSEAAPVVDPTQVSMGQTFTSDYLKEAVVGREHRDLWALTGQAAGVDSSKGIRVLGSTAVENAFLVDGIDTTYPFNGLQSFSRLSYFEAVDEIAFHTAGFEAEYGLATGGVVNLVTKSGGNELSGSLDFRYSDESFATSGDHFDPDEEPRSTSILGTSLGGPILRDRLWFFASLDHVEEKNTPSGAPTTANRESIAWLGKLTGQAGSRWSLTGKLFADGADATDADSGQFTVPEATASIYPETLFAQGEALGQLSARLLFSFRLGLQDGRFDFLPTDGDLETIGHFNLVTGRTYGNFSFQDYQETECLEAEADLTWFADGIAGSHELKAGLRYGERGFSDDTCFNGHGACRAGAESFFFRDVVDQAGQNRPFLLEVFEGLGRQDFDGTSTSAYLQDAWRLTRGLTLQLGLRWDRSEMTNDVGARIADLDLLQPRLGVAWDLRGDGRNILRASWGKFMHPSSLDVAFWVGEKFGPSSFWLSCSSALGIADPGLCSAVAAAIGQEYRTDPEGWDPAGWVFGSVFRAEPNRTSPDLEPMYADELVVGFERELFRRTSLELSYVKKDTHNIFEDTCSGNLPEPSADAECGFNVVANLPPARRDYEGWLLRFESRAHDWAHLLASYAYSDSKGSIDPFGISSAFDLYPEHWVNRYGYLEDHSRHRLKVNGYALLPWDLSLGVAGGWSSEFRWTPFQSVTPYGEELVEPRGSRQGNSRYEIDLQLMKGFRIGPARLRLIGTVYNLSDSERPTEVCERVTGCGAFEMGDPVAWQEPRRYEVGVRVEL